jgi:hypothetical protein
MEPIFIVVVLLTVVLIFRVTFVKSGTIKIAKRSTLRGRLLFFQSKTRILWPGVNVTWRIFETIPSVEYPLEFTNSPITLLYNIRDGQEKGRYTIEPEEPYLNGTGLTIRIHLVVRWRINSNSTSLDLLDGDFKKIDEENLNYAKSRMNSLIQTSYKYVTKTSDLIAMKNSPLSTAQFYILNSDLIVTEGISISKISFENDVTNAFALHILSVLYSTPI